MLKHRKINDYTTNAHIVMKSLVALIVISSVVRAFVRRLYIQPGDLCLHASNGIFSHNSGAASQFEKADPNDVDYRGEPYDYGSIMHYSKYQGNNRPNAMTMEPIKANAEIGQRKSPSKSDIRQARLMYGCGGTFT